MLEQYAIIGTWCDRSAGSGSVVISDYVAGLLVTTTDDGEEVLGPPDDFRSIQGESGTSILCRILRPPTLELLRYGAIRESIAAARYVALYGFQETRAWDGPNDYVIDTGEGSCGVVRFIATGCVAAMINYDPWRKLDVAQVCATIPPTLRDAAEEICKLPLLNSPAQLGISCLLWSEGEALRAHEPWPIAYKFGGELLRQEILDDELWQAEAAVYYDLDKPTLALIISVARRRVASTGSLALTGDDFRAIVPEESPHYTQAVQLLSDIGFRMR